jgi:hypothetical protein
MKIIVSFLISSLGLALVSCHPPQIAHRDLITIEGTVPLTENDNSKGELCFSVRYQFSGVTSGTEKPKTVDKKFCASVEVKDGKFYLEQVAQFVLPYKVTTVLGIENITFQSMEKKSTLADYQIMTTFRGKFKSLEQVGSTHQVKMEFQLEKKSPVSDLTMVVDGCHRSGISVNYEDNCINWRIAPALAEACGKLSYNNQYNCLVQAAKEQGTYR